MMGLVVLCGCGTAAPGMSSEPAGPATVAGSTSGADGGGSAGSGAQTAPGVASDGTGGDGTANTGSCEGLSDESEDTSDAASGSAAHSVSPKEQCEAASYWSSGRLTPWEAGAGNAAGDRSDGQLARVEDAYAAERKDENVQTVDTDGRSALADNEHAVRLASYAVIDDRALRVYFMGGACETYRMTVEETDAQVRVTLLARAAGDATDGGGCAAVASYASATVGLDRAIGNRAVIDGGTAAGSED